MINKLLSSVLIFLVFSFILCLTNVGAKDLKPIPGAGWHYPWHDEYEEWKPVKNGVDQRQFDQKILESYGWNAQDVEKIKEYLPEPMYRIMKNPDVWGKVRINVTPFLENKGRLYKKYRNGTIENKGKATITEKGWYANYDFYGAPFYPPETGRELIWDFKWRFSPDDRYLCVANWMTNRDGHVRYQTSDGNLMFFYGRLECDPKPVYKPNPEDLYRIDVYANAHPYEMQGTLSVIKQSNDPDTEDALWMYLPALRRVRHLSTAQRTDKLPGGQDMMWDNMDTFNGNPSEFNFKMLGKKKILVLHNCKPKSSWVEGQHFSAVDNYWQYRECYVNEMTPKDPNYPYSRIIQYTDKDSFISYYSLWYDQKGELALASIFGYYMTKEGIYVPQIMNHIDFQRIHSTGYAATGPEFNLGLTPDYFSLQNLQQEYPSR